MPGVVDSVEKRGHVEHLRNTKSQDFGQELLQQLWFMADEPRAKGRVLNSVGDSPHSAGAGWTCTHSPPEPLCLSAGLQRDRPWEEPGRGRVSPCPAQRGLQFGPKSGPEDSYKYKSL